MTPTVPNQSARLATLLASMVFGTVAACIGLNAIIRSHQSQTSLKKLVSAPMTLKIDVSQITNVGIVATVGSILVGGLSCIFFNITLFPFLRKWANKTLRLQVITLSFSGLWVLACMIPYMVYFMNDHADVRAFVGETELPQSLVAQTAAKSGHSTEYQTMWYLRLLAIFPWFSIVSAFLSAFVAWRSTAAVNALPADGVTAKPTKHANSSKGSVVETEKVESA